MNREILYLKEADFLFIFNKIQEISKKEGAELAPQYQKEIEGIKRLYALSESLRSNYYKGIEEKSVFLFLSIAKNHYFSNGNKRLSVFCLIYFLWLNGARFKTKDFKTIQKIIRVSFVSKISKNKKVTLNLNHTLKIESLAKWAVENPKKLTFEEQKEAVLKILKEIFLNF